MGRWSRSLGGLRVGNVAVRGTSTATMGCASWMNYRKTFDEMKSEFSTSSPTTRDAPPRMDHRGYRDGDSVLLRSEQAWRSKAAGQAFHGLLDPRHLTEQIVD